MVRRPHTPSEHESFQPPNPPRRSSGPCTSAPQGARRAKATGKPPSGPHIGSSTRPTCDGETLWLWGRPQQPPSRPRPWDFPIQAPSRLSGSGLARDRPGVQRGTLPPASALGRACVLGGGQRRRVGRRPSPLGLLGSCPHLPDLGFTDESAALRDPSQSRVAARNASSALHLGAAGKSEGRSRTPLAVCARSIHRATSQARPSSPGTPAGLFDYRCVAPRPICLWMSAACCPQQQQQLGSLPYSILLRPRASSVCTRAPIMEGPPRLSDM